MENLITIKNISKTYQFGEIKTIALKDVSVDVVSGEFLMIIGRNGSGKSTLLRQIGLLDTPDNGEIFISGVKATGISEKIRSNIRLDKIGYVFQDYALVSDLTATENIMLPAMMKETTGQARIKACKLIKQIGLEKRANNLPNQLSGGEQQKVAIARALVNDPEIIIADEPTANLDSTAAKEIINIFSELNSHGHTIIMVTHEKEEETVASRIIRLADGLVMNY